MAKPYLLQQLENNKMEEYENGVVYISWWPEKTTFYEECVEAINNGKIIITLFDDIEKPNDNTIRYHDILGICQYISQDELIFNCISVNQPGTSITIYVYSDNTYIMGFGTNGLEGSVWYLDDFESNFINYRVLRPIKFSTSTPVASDGRTGDIWIKYST